MIAGMRSDGIYTPPGLEPAIQYPGNAGGPNWGGVSIDPTRGVLYVNSMRVPSVVQLLPRAEFEKLDASSVRYPEMLAPMKGHAVWAAHRAAARPARRAVQPAAVGRSCRPST